MKELANIVMLRIAADWKIVAINLEFDQPTIRIIQQRGGSNDPENCCLEIVTKWLTEGKGMGPRTWCTLLAALKNSPQLTSFTQQIESDLTQMTTYVTNNDIIIIIITLLYRQHDHPAGNRSRKWCAML